MTIACASERATATQPNASVSLSLSLSRVRVRVRVQCVRTVDVRTRSERQNVHEELLVGARARQQSADAGPERSSRFA